MRTDEIEDGAEGLEEIRAELARARGPAFWKRLEELAGTAPFQAFLRREFPSQAERFGNELVRRDFLRLMGASLAVTGLGACTRQPEEKIVPYAAAPEDVVPGRPRFFATAMPRDGDALGLLVESHMGRPTKIEGNPDHPSSLGATDALAQAATLGLYDPDRSHSLLLAGRIDTWGAFLTELKGRLDGLAAVEGEGLRILTGEVRSPTLIGQLERLVSELPRARWHRWTPVHRDNVRRGAELAFGRDVDTRYAFDQARVVVALDADFLAAGPGGVRYARDFAAARRGRAGTATMNRLYSVESSVSLTGAMADHRLALSPSRVEDFARTLARELGVEVEAPEVEEELLRFARVAARDLRASSGAGIVVPGPWQTPVVHALAHAINHALLDVGTTVEHTRPIVPAADANASLRTLVDDIRAGRVTTLVMLEGNPVYDAPADLDFAGALRTVPFRVHLSLHVDETSRLCNWHVPQAHFLESWSDARAFDGTTSIVQPLIAPLYRGKTAHEIVSALLGEAGRSPYEIVREHWRRRLGEDVADAEFERSWQTALHDGIVPGTREPREDVRLLDRLELGPPSSPRVGLELAFRPDASAYDGRYANNGWLQETPRPLTRLTWDNAALVSTRTAEALGLASGDVVALTAGERRVEAPVWVAPGHPDETFTLHLGYGRTSAGRLADGVGFDAYRLRTSYAPWSLDDARVERTGRRVELASVQDHARMEGRELVKVKSFDRFRTDPHVERHDVSDLSLYPDHPYEGYSWGMVIDLNACIGCNACMVACQSENNVPIVGKEEVLRGRELHWIRIDRYYEEQGAEEEPRVLHQPVPCMHCENAPCEVVCPVAATVHGPEGLNEMVYNRCVGTRYCSNNCPYKVRRFNFFHYADYDTESLKLGNNPDVTIRSRGVMEKCTYCVQRINQARITAKKEDRGIREGELKTACQQVCPTQAIAFGDINDDSTEVSLLRREPHHYGLLEELGTRPRTTYLAKLENPNPELGGS